MLAMLEQRGGNGYNAPRQIHEKNNSKNMMVKACVILFSLVFSFLAIVTLVKPSKNGTFIDFAKQEKKNKRTPL